MHLSTLNPTDTARVVDVAATALRRYYRRPGLPSSPKPRGRPAKILAAARELGAALAKRYPTYVQGSEAATRKLFERVLSGNTRRLRFAQAERLLKLVACVDQPADDEADRLWIDLTTRQEWRADWFEPATDAAAVALRLRSWDAEILRDEYVAFRRRRGLALGLVPPLSAFKSRVVTAKRLLGAQVPVQEFATATEATEGGPVSASSNELRALKWVADTEKGASSTDRALRLRAGSRRWSSWSIGSR